MVFGESKNAWRPSGRPRGVSGAWIRLAFAASLASPAAAAGSGAGQRGWSLFALGGFSIACPGTPQSPSGQKPSDGFREWTIAQGKGSYVFSLARVGPAVANAPAEPILRQCVNGLVSSSKGTIVAERDLLLDGWMGVEVRYRTDAGSDVQLRAYVVKDQILNLILAHPVGSAPPDGANRFFDSVQLPSDVGKGTFSEPGPKFAKFDLESSGFTVRVPLGVQSQIIKASETGSVEMHNFVSVYLNRTYMGFVIDPPPNAKVDLDSDPTGKAAQAINKTIAGMLQQVPSKTDSRDTALGKAWMLDFDAGHGLAGHIETYVRNNHTYSIVAVVPAAMMGAGEVKAFFDSVTLPEKK